CLKHLSNYAATALHDEQTARLVLRAMRKCPNEDEEGPALIIVWNDAGFNDIPAAAMASGDKLSSPYCRHWTYASNTVFNGTYNSCLV
ncbi:3043_t:CDS:1, partial [Paraglomus brasilianum]